VKILGDQNQSFGTNKQTLNNIKLLENPETVAVVTGQQVGLFGGPLYTIYKALTAIQLAQSLKEKHSFPAIPIFWLAADDDDFAEINQSSIVDKSNQLVKLEYTPHTPVSNKSASKIIFEEKVNETITQLESGLFDTEFKLRIFAELKECYQPGKSFSTAFGQWMTKLFGIYGLILIDPTDARVRKLAGTLFKKEIAEQTKIKALIQTTTNTLLEKGYHQQVALQEDKTNLFIEYAGSRYPIRREGSRYLFSGTNMRYTAEELVEVIDQTPEQFSPNVLLRPIMEDAIIPTIAYVTGPNELAYYAQLKDAYQFFGIKMPIIVPRVSLTILEKKIGETLDKYHISINALFQNAEKAVSDALKQSLPKEIEAEVKQVKEQIETQYQQLNDKVTQWEPSLKDAITSSRNAVLHQLNSIENKIGLAHKKKNETVREQLNKLVNHLVPERNLQERTLNLIPYLVKYNFDFIDQLYSVIDWNSRDHQILKIS
ncbi:MAG: bacillithiol biosynthesis cysteine-adding enzyme BshC, partial [bacterium]|nr:bacillithiol biosynthesis cysteine-adding enzyme BshC [bacterium]